MSLLVCKETVLKKILVIDFWGLGDLILATGAIKSLIDQGYEVGVLTKSISRQLVQPTLPKVTFHEISIPWTSHRNKYEFWNWNWSDLWSVILDLRKERYNCSVSIRADPREDLIPRLAGIPKIYGRRRWKWWRLINKPIEGFENQHQVIKWQKAIKSITSNDSVCTPFLENPSSVKEERILLHVGASVEVRRWFLPQWQELIDEIKASYRYPVEVITDLDGFGKSLKADKIHQGISLSEMSNLLGSSLLVIGNDSGPTHIASALGIKTVTIFGPQKSDYFKPWSEISVVIEGGECEYKPCKDYCKFSSPKCLEAVTVESVAQAVKDALAL